MLKTEFAVKGFPTRRDTLALKRESETKIMSDEGDWRWIFIGQADSL